MFTGIIEEVGKITNIVPSGSNITFYIKSDLREATVDDSIACNGICLTIEGIKGGIYQFTAIEETLKKTTAGSWQIGDSINLERTLVFNGRIDGHLVQGHVDGVGFCTGIKKKDGSMELTFSFNKTFSELIIEKGSICVNGVSLTAFNVGNTEFTVAIIPYTLEHTTFGLVQRGTLVNLEFDLLGKYIQRYLTLQGVE